MEEAGNEQQTESSQQHAEMPEGTWPEVVPDPYVWVRKSPWDGWQAPQTQEATMAELLAQWFDLLGDALYRVQEGYWAPHHLGALVPPPSLFLSALEWLDEVSPPPSPGAGRHAD